MSKILFWLAIILVALLVMRLLARHSASTHRKQSQPARKKGPKRVEAMVQCAHCGLHLPASDAVHSHGNTWCSHEHARLGSQR